MSTPPFGDPRGLAQRLMESPFVVSIYESRLWRRNPVVEALLGISFDAELEQIAAATHIDEASRVLDLACGSGIYTRRLAKRLDESQVVGLDLSGPMLRYAYRTARNERLPNLSLIQGSALALPFASSSFDVVNCCGALHLFADVPEALTEIGRVLTRGGRFAAAVIRVAETPAGRRTAERRLKRLGVYSFSRTDLQQQLRRTGFDDIEVLHEGRIWMIVTARRNPA